MTERLYLGCLYSILFFFLICFSHFDIGLCTRKGDQSERIKCKKTKKKNNKHKYWNSLSLVERET